MIFVDSNVPMYLVGAPQPHKFDSLRMLERLVVEGERLVTDAEVFHEISHRQVAIGRRDAIQTAFEALRGFIDEVYPVTMPNVERAKSIVLGFERLTARDALHRAVMEDQAIARIMTFDIGFDEFPGV